MKVTKALEDMMRHIIEMAPLRHSYTTVGPENLEAWRADVEAILRRALGVELDERPPVSCDWISQRDMGEYVRHYVRLKAGEWLIPAYVLIPKNIQGKAPGAVAMHGHGPGKVSVCGIPQDIKGRPFKIEGERDYAVQAVRNGYVTIAPDQFGFGEMMLHEDLQRNAPNSCHQLSMRLFMAGKTTIGMRVLEAMLCVDFLASLDYVNAERIVILGNSGGGTTSLFTGALDKRIWASVVSCYFNTFRRSILAMYHCACNYIPGLLEELEMYDIAALVAPRLLYVIAGKEDPIYPIQGVEEAFPIVEEIYERLGARGNLGLYIGPEGHRFYAAEVWDWLRQRL